MKRMSLWVGAFWIVTAIFFPLAVDSQTQSGPGEWEKVVSAAKKEGEVVVWGPSGRNYENLFIARFQKAFPGIRTSYFGGETSPLGRRFVEEWKAGVAQVDVLTLGSSFINSTIKPAGALQAVRPFLVLPEVKDETKWLQKKLWFVDEEQQYIFWAEGTVVPALALGQSVDAKEFSSYWDLLQPKWRGTIVMGDPQTGGTGAAGGLMFFYQKSLGSDFTARFYRETQATLSRDYRQMIDWLWKGKYSIHPFPSTEEALQALRQGVSIKLVSNLKEGAPLLAGSGGVFSVPNKIPHPNAARVFINWILSPDGQKAFQEEVGNVSLRTDISKDGLEPATVPKAGVNYFLPNLYTEAKAIKAMRDDIVKALQAREGK